MASVSSRTRSKNVPLFRCLPEKSKRLRKSDEDDMGLDHYVSRCKKMKVKRETFVLPKNVKVISIDDDDDVEMFDAKDGSFLEKKCGLDEDNPISIGSDEYGENDEEDSIGFGGDNEEEEEEEEKEVVDVKEEVKTDESKGSGEFDDKDKNFVDLDDSAESGDDSDSVTDESEDDDDSEDEDFDVDKVNDMDDNSSSGSHYDDEEEEEVEEEEEEVEEEEEKEKKKGGRKYLNVVEDLVREVMDKQSGISEMNDEEINVENEEMKDKSPSVNNGEMEHSDYGEEISDKNPSVNNDEVEHSDYGSVAISNAFEKKKDSFVHTDEVEHSDRIKGSSSSSNQKEISDIQKAVQNVSDDDVNVSKAKESVNLHDDLDVVNYDDVNVGKTKESVNVRDDFDVVNVTKVKESVNLCGDIDVTKIKVKVEDIADPTECVKVADSHKGKEKYVGGLGVDGVSLVETKEEEMKNESVVFEFKYDAFDRRDRQPPPVIVETPTSIWSFKKVGKVPKTKEDEEEEVLWDEMETALRESKAVYKNEASEAKKAKSVNFTKAKFKSNVKYNAKHNNSVNVAGFDKGKKKYVEGLGVGGVLSAQTKQEKMKESEKQKIMENKGRDYKGITNIPIEKKESDKEKMMENNERDYDGISNTPTEKKEYTDNNGFNQSVKSPHFMPKELRSLELLAQCYWERKNTMNKDSIVLEVNEDCVDRQDTQPPPVSVDTPHERIWSLKKVEKVEKTKEEEENEVIWDELETSLRESEAVSKIGNLETDEASGSPSCCCEHNIFLDEEIGEFCKSCGVVITEIKYISPLVMDRFPGEGSGRKASFDGVNVSHVDGSRLNVSDNDNDSKTNFSRNEGTVWDLIPDLKQTLYPHQIEGFEFIWKNLAGHTELQKLKNADLCSEGGCIISHAPGTGKTRLTMVFLKAYLKAFPKCLPIIVAPASILLTWEDEFKKWDIGVPFHNLSNPELSGKEHPDAVETFDMSNTQHDVHETRMAKLISWFKEASILGISYNLFGKKCQDKKKHENVKEREGNCDMRKVLLNSPGLIVLDEGHTPRNQRSHIWKVFSKLQTQKRIILSGTPFQNNFWELYSTLSLVKPSFPNTIPPELKSFCQNQGYKSSKKCNWEPVLLNKTRDPSDDQIKKFKLLMDPFVHVHKGAILESKLPGLRDCLVTLKAGSLQNEILKSIKRSQNTIFNFERKVALTSVHPSLFLECALSEEEKSALDKDHLEKIRLNPHEGVKTKFLFEFVRLCDAFHEKVLVFSQFRAPLQLIKDQLNLAFKWTEGKEVLVMSGEDPPKVKQSVIHSFNDENCQAKVLLASTKACSEGISLVGASRVVLLDVVWNPSVERQAISRAYRIGQKKVVYTYHLLAEGTTEEEKYGKQAEKDRLSELVFSAKNAANNDKSKSSAVNFEDRVLDEMTKHEKLKGIFVKCVVLRKERDVV